MPQKVHLWGVVITVLAPARVHALALVGMVASQRVTPSVTLIASILVVKSLRRVERVGIFLI